MLQMEKNETIRVCIPAESCHMIYSYHDAFSDMQMSGFRGGGIQPIERRHHEIHLVSPVNRYTEHGAMELSLSWTRLSIIC